MTKYQAVALAAYLNHLGVGPFDAVGPTILSKDPLSSSYGAWYVVYQETPTGYRWAAREETEE